MRLEDKELEGPDLEREQGLEQLEDETHEHDKKLPEYAGPEVVDEHPHRARMFDALQAILAGENLSIPMLYLPQREALALEALQSAVTGRDRSMNTFMFAEDRKSLLEQALAVLQQNLTRGDAETLSVLHAKYDALTENVANLRDELLGLEDAQDDLIEQKQRDELHTEAETDDSDDKDKDKDAGTSFIASALAQVETAPSPFQSTLVGPELPEARTSPTTLEGPEIEVEPAYVSTLEGPEVVEAPKRSSLYDEEDAPIVPPHLRPRLAAHQPVGMRTDDYQERAFAPHVDDGRGPAPPTSADRQREREAPPPEPTHSPQPATASRASSAPTIEPPVEESPKPTGRRGLSVRSSDKPGKKK